MGKCGLVSSGPMTDCCENGNELSGSTKGGKFFDLLSYCQLLKKDSVPCS
jgi:hypothetical protein